jgi:nitrite reductase (NADH) small subunit
MCRWTKVAAVGECPPGTAREVVVGDDVIALVNFEGEFYAIDGMCAHQGGPLANGELQRETVTCPWHGWQYDVRTGKHLTNPSIRQRQFNVRVVGNTIFIGGPLELEADCAGNGRP